MELVQWTTIDIIAAYFGGIVLCMALWAIKTNHREAGLALFGIGIIHMIGLLLLGGA